MPDEKQKQSPKQPQKLPPPKPVSPPYPRPAPLEHKEWIERSHTPREPKK